MLDKKTVLVLGAGSSAEFKLPAGNGLAKNIADRTFFWFGYSGQMERGDAELYRAVRSRFSSQNEVLAAGRRISEGLPFSRSIDDFLYNHGEDKIVVTLGKASIAQCILEAESKSTLVSFQNIENGSPSRGISNHIDTWIQKFFSYLQTGVRRQNVGEIFDRLSIINFNYDRCVETYFYHALQLAYGISSEEAAAVMKTLDITHPYGQVGALPWQNAAGGIRFGEKPHESIILRLADSIRTFTEQAHEDEEKRHWHSMIQHCEQLIFLGFAFHQQNVDLLSSEDTRAALPRVVATTYDTSSADVLVFERRIRQLLNVSATDVLHQIKPAEFVPSTCSSMIGSHGLDLFS